MKREGRARWPHAAAGLFVVGALGWAALVPESYYGLVQEDGPVEWLTVGLFGAAAVSRLGAAWRSRRVFDGLVGLFCLFVAGEEISWGQRLLGFTPPDWFLESNFQQEANLHNFAAVFGRPGTVLAVLLAAYGVALPLAARWRGIRPLMARLGATAPPAGAAPWFAVAAVLLVAYPVEFTGEWTEALAGALFLATGPGGRAALPWAAALVVAAVMTPVSLVARDPGGRLSACAGREAEALLRDVVAGEAATAELAMMRYVHKRVHAAVQAGYVDAAGAAGYLAEAGCPGETAGETETRRRYGVDPWGMSYWLESEVVESGRRVAVYSMGPNRRRDGDAGEAAGDDVVVYAVLEPAP